MYWCFRNIFGKLIEKIDKQFKGIGLDGCAIRAYHSNGWLANSDGRKNQKEGNEAEYHDSRCMPGQPHKGHQVGSL